MSRRHEPDGEFVLLPHHPPELAHWHREEQRERREHHRARAAELEQARRRLDQIDLQIAGLQRLQAAETRDGLRRAGFTVDDYDLPPFPHRLERRSGKTPSAPDRDTAAGKPTRRPDDQRTLKHYVGGYVTAIR